MGLKTIVVHLTNDEDHVVRMEVAKSLARQHDAFLTALYITRPSDNLQHIAGRGVSQVFLEEAMASAERHAKELELEFKDYCSRQNIPNEWIVADGEHLEELARHAHAADLLIVTRPQDENLEDRVRTRLAEQVIMNTGLPVMVLPPGFEDNWTPKRVLIGWKGTREAVRAVRDSLSILQQAEKVLVGTVHPNAEDAISTLEISKYLERQGIDAETIDLMEDEGTGRTLLSMAQAHQCDLLVAGAYGHSRLREIFVGGVTRHLLRHSDMPLLLSH